MLLKLKNEYGQPSISASVLFADRSWAWQALTGQEEQIIWLRGEEGWKYKMDLELQREAMEKERKAMEDALKAREAEMQRIREVTFHSRCWL